MSILHGAAKRGNLILVEKEVEERGRDPQEKATEWPHSTPLHRAAGYVKPWVQYIYNKFIMHV